jgi:hypothetical protein
MLINLDTVRVALYEMPGLHYAWTGSLEDFVADNELELDETADICDALADAGQFYGGGGAAPEYKLVKVPS